jgi:hypothetical protein
VLNPNLIRNKDNKDNKDNNLIILNSLITPISLLEDDFDDLLLYNSNNSNNNHKSIFKENQNIYNSLNNNKGLINNSTLNKVDKIEIKDLVEPNTYKEAINSPYKDKWVNSIELELKTLNNNKT